MSNSRPPHGSGAGGKPATGSGPALDFLVFLVVILIGLVAWAGLLYR